MSDIVAISFIYQFYPPRMQSSYTATTFLPIALSVIMLGLGLSLQVSDFTRILKFPKAVFVGLFCQMFLMPVICFFVTKAFSLSPQMAVGMMLLAASPGGAVANLYSHLSRGDVALNITLTATNSLLTLFTIPLIVSLSLQYFLEEGQYIPMQFKKIMEVFMLVFIPVAAGMFIKKHFPELSDRLSKPVKITSAFFLAAVVIAATYQEKEKLYEYFIQVGVAALVFNIISLALGYFLPRLARLSKRESIAIGMEIGIHNGTLAIFLAVNVLSAPVMAIPAAVYSLLMFFTAAVFGWLVNQTNTASYKSAFTRHRN
ncbi:MAG TPA: bile acid:sodium symporter family protein [Chitinophagales bacterium]|nr:bile acid:sodium symporter family protein [Chitinophagales bacterium]